MGRLAAVATLALSAALGELFVADVRIHAQAPDLIWASPPAVGEAVALGAASDGARAESPLPEGMSLQSLGDVLRALGTPDKAAMRGGREIAIFRQAAPAVALLKTKDGSGSGVVLQNGLILTNRHVVEGIGAVQVFFKPDDQNKSKSTEVRLGQVKVVDPKRDLAIVAPQSLPERFKFLKIATRDDLEVGTDVYAIGHPLGYTWTFTQGIISGYRAIKTDQERYTSIQTQTPINPGNSGGPLLNADVEVVGINTFVRDISLVEKTEVAGEKVAIARPAQGLNFAVSARDVREFLSEVESGKFEKLALQVPAPASGCAGQLVLNGRAKSNDAALKTFSLRCDNKIDAWQVFPDDKSKPVQFHFDPDRTGKSSIVILSNPATGKWETSLWDLFRDRTFAVIGHHDDGKLKPTRFEFARS